MKILLLGGSGMLGHQLYHSLRVRHQVKVSLSGTISQYSAQQLFHAADVYQNIDVRIDADLQSMLDDFHPDAVINAVGIVKQLKAATQAIPSITLNALLPHRLDWLCGLSGARLIHVSTDCVFSGKQGHYTESDVPDAEDLYGQSKALGEVRASDHSLTLRTSIIGLQLQRQTGLIEWFLAQKGTVRGFTKAIYTGVTTLEFAKIIEHILVSYPGLCGLWQLASLPITKYDLLRMLQEMISKEDVRIIPDETVVCDRSLQGHKLAEKIQYGVAPWDTMLAELALQIAQRQRK